MDIARRFILGRYLPGTSLMHRIDGRVKIITMVFISVAVFMATLPQHLLISFVGLLIIIPFSGMKPISLLKGIVPIVWIAAFTAAVHLRNPEMAVLMSGRIIILFLWATVLTSTTEVTGLSSAVAWFIRPLRFTGISPEKTALTFSIALRFFPFVLEEAESIIKAQKIRAEKFPLKKKVESFSIAFIIRLLKKAQAIDDSIRVRRLLEDGHFSAGRMKKFSRYDYVALAAGLLLAAVTVIL